MVRNTLCIVVVRKNYHLMSCSLLNQYRLIWKLYIQTNRLETFFVSPAASLFQLPAARGCHDPNLHPHMCWLAVPPSTLSLLLGTLPSFYLHRIFSCLKKGSILHSLSKGRRGNDQFQCNLQTRVPVHYFCT